ncbi:MAG: sulfatase-like hydrolase/transferase [Bacilli bacterium]
MKVKVKSASSDLFRNPKEYEKILFIVNESWGVVDEKIQNDIISSAVKNTEIVEYNKIAFNGFTINAEFRELCKNNVKHFNLKEQKSGFDNCLPKIYQKNGYETIAMHGSTSYMYDRKYWYPRVGFRKLIFKDTLINKKSKCFSFPGMCDRDLLTYILQSFKENEKVFFYWLTLNTHMNYDMRDLKVDIFNCEFYNIGSNSPSCRNLKLQKQFFYYLSKLLERPEMKGVYIVVVGDHSPPMHGSEKSVFIKGQVPVLIMRVV